jgi:phenylacetate-CoA ligase
MLGRLAYAHLVHPLYHKAKRDGVNEALTELRRNQWLTVDMLASIQCEKLERLLVYAHRNVPYYSDVLDGLDLDPARAAQPEHFSRLPVLTKALIRQNRARLCSTTLAGNRLHANSTSGSTGEPLCFYTDDRISAYLKASVIRNKEWTGWRMSSREACLWGAAIDGTKASALRGRLHAAVTGSLFLSAYDLSERVMDRYLSSIAAYKPFLLVSYPSILEVFASHCRRRVVKLDSLRAIITSAETLWPHQREIIERHLGVSVYNRYGCREVGDIAHECGSHQGLHVNADCLLIEIVDSSGQACRPGETGDILVTSLHNYGMPLIRYAIGDRATWSTERTCPCGRGLPLLGVVEGRSMDVVSTRGGQHIGGTYWTILLRSRPGLAQFQVVQDTLDGITVRYVRGDAFDPAVLEYYSARVNEKTAGELRVAFKEETDIERNAGGKRRLVVSNIGAGAPV